MSEKARILVVEDEESIRDGVRDVLTYHGYEVEAVESGEAGLEAVLSRPVELVMLDVMLPGVNGFDVCRQARDAGSTVAILMLTAKGSEDDVVEGLRAGADDYVYDVAPDGRFLMVRSAQRADSVHVVLNWSEELKRLVPTQ